MKLPYTLAVAGLFCATALTLPQHAHAGTYGMQTFNSYATGATNLGDGTTIASSTNVASVQGSGDRYLRLTRSGTNGTAASFKLPDLDPGQEVESFTVTFDLLMSTSGTPADGVSINFGNIPAGNGGGEGGFAMDDGLVIAWDTYNNGGGDPQSVEIFSDGISIDNNTQNFGSVHNDWTPVVINWDSNGLDVTYNGQTLASNLPTPGFVPSPGNTFAFSGRTGGATQNTYIDDLQVTTTTASAVETGGPIINEFVTDNTDLEDEDLDSPDWIEIYNGQNATANLAGHYLTDDPLLPTKWQLPAVTMAAYEYLVVFASSKDRPNPAGVLHTNFELAKSGGYLALVAPNGSTVISEFNYGAQAEDVAYGELGSARTLGYLETPTPGAKNSGLQAAGPPAEDVVYDKTGGVFNGSVTLDILDPVSPTAVVRYTLDDTIPHAGSTVFNGTPFNFSNTATVRARVFDTGRLPGEVKSRTFLELANDVANFNSALPILVADSFGVPVDSFTSSGSRPFRRVYTTVFERDPNTGLARVTDAPDFTGRGGMHVRGQSSSGFPKKQYAWETWNNDDEDKNVSILGMPSESDWIVHAPYSDKTLMRNVMVYSLARQLNGDGGGMRTRFVELFFNQNGGTVSMADYRGVYVVMEKIKRDKNRVDIEKLNDSVTDPALITGGYIFKKDKTPWSQPWNTATEGVPLDMHDPDTVNSAQFNYLRDYVNAFESALHGGNFDDPNTGYAAYIDTLSFIDNHLFVEVFKEIDGYRISQYFSKDRDEKIRALPVWDYNLALGNANYLQGQNPTGWYYTQLSGTNYYWYQRLFQDTEFDLSYWDRFWELRRSIFTDSHLLAEIDIHDTELDLPNSSGQSAVTRNFNEWNNLLGNYTWPNADGYQTRTTHQAEVDWMKNWLTQRMAWIETQSRGTSGIARPPTFNQYGGDVAGGFNLTMSDPNGWGGASIYYTTDGSDPRVPGNGAGTGIDFALESDGCEVLVPSVANGGSTLSVAQWTNPAAPPNAGSWTPGPQGVGYERSANNAYDPYFSTDVEADMYQTNQSVYIRIPFTASAADVANVSSMTLRMRYDDGFVAYLNGVQIAAANNPASPQWNSGATGSHTDSIAITYVDFNAAAGVGALVEGQNVLAIHGLNNGTGSSDALWSAELVGQAGGGNAPSGTASIYSGPVSLNSAVEVKARVYDGAKWSPLSRGLFVVAAVPASGTNVVISELDYRPAEATVAEINAGYSRGDFEYLELMNIDPVNPVSLEGASFSAGITFGWDNTMPPEALVIPPGGRIVVVDNPDAFAFRHGGSGAIVAGNYSGSLSNDGELVTLLDSGGGTIKSFTYNDVEPWPVAADGDGYSLVLIDPLANPDHNDPLSWRSSPVPGGTPGDTETVAFVGDPSSDDDGDGQSAFLEYALGSIGSDPNSRATITTTAETFSVEGVPDDYLVFAFPVNLSAGPVNYTVQGSDDLDGWVNMGASLEYLSTTNNGDGTAIVRYRLTFPFDPSLATRGFLRLLVTE